ncbi:MAG: hypothetical protein K2P57_11450 [Burkholderiales bacterium]|nr:hypothetical protein [Burkholderiales bacterium]
MKTDRYSKLLMALAFGLGGLSLAHADGTDDRSSKANCTGTVVNACGLKVIKSVCTGGTQTGTDDDMDEDHEHHDFTNERDKNVDGSHRYSDDDKSPPSGSAFDFDYTDWHGNRHHVDHGQRMGSAPDGKLTICHRMGGARVTLDVPDDQVKGVKAHGHAGHDMDTVGRCEDQDDGAGHDDYNKVAAATKLSQKSRVTGSVAACLATTAGCNAQGVSCSIPLGGSASTPPGSVLPDNGAPNRGGVRGLH